MRREDAERLKEKLNLAILQSPGARVAIVGLGEIALDVAALPAFKAGLAELVGMFVPEGDGPLQPLAALGGAKADIVVIAEDAGKEALLKEVAPMVPAATKVIVGGYGHYAFRDALFDRVRQEALIPSLANGYPNCLIHIYQCLRNAHRLGLQGAVAEFGMFKGGTTMLISRFIEELGADWKVYGFDTFDGFPARRSPLDMYEHPDCVFRDAGQVRAMFAGRNVEIVEGDVVQTVAQLGGEDLLFSFIDTDNFTSASAIVEVVAERTLAGGAILFDHWTGTDQFVDTIGERLAAAALLDDARYFNLHGTGVFLRQT